MDLAKGFALLGKMVTTHDDPVSKRQVTHVAADGFVRLAGQCSDVNPDYLTVVDARTPTREAN